MVLGLLGLCDVPMENLPCSPTALGQGALAGPGMLPRLSAAFRPQLALLVCTALSSPPLPDLQAHFFLNPP